MSTFFSWILPNQVAGGWTALAIMSLLNPHILAGYPFSTKSEKMLEAFLVTQKLLWEASFNLSYMYVPYILILGRVHLKYLGQVKVNASGC